MIAKFKTENVEYVLEEKGYSRNGHFSLSEVELKELQVGEPAVFYIQIGEQKRIINTDIVYQIEQAPVSFKRDAIIDIQIFRIKVIRKEKQPISLMKLGTETEVRSWAKERFKNKKDTMTILLFPSKEVNRKCQ
ncbi:hypothetical protein V1503_24200 [Bacillus sp. SCS-151]|uniref:hypothetical protein n=1 Tax=Nanhaiella sioensis TaxID=3115293 RepID=UPI00397E9115